MTSQTPERGTELNEEDNAVIDAVFMWEGTLETPADFPGTLDAALAPALAAIRRHAAAQALEEAATDFEDNIGVNDFDEQARRDGKRWGHIEESWEHQGPYMDWLRARAASIRDDL